MRIRLMPRTIDMPRDLRITIIARQSSRSASVRGFKASLCEAKEGSNCYSRKLRITNHIHRNQYINYIRQTLLLIPKTII
jgi:hypothetical protein